MTSYGYERIMVLSRCIFIRGRSLTIALAFHGHTAGCYENSDGHIVYDLTLANGYAFHQ
jgi:hypothetical protein